MPQQGTILLGVISHCHKSKDPSEFTLKYSDILTMGLFFIFSFDLSYCLIWKSFTKTFKLANDGNPDQTTFFVENERIKIAVIKQFYLIIFNKYGRAFDKREYFVTIRNDLC